MVESSCFKHHSWIEFLVPCLALRVVSRFITEKANIDLLFHHFEIPGAWLCLWIHPLASAGSKTLNRSTHTYAHNRINNAQRGINSLTSRRQNAPFVISRSWTALRRNRMLRKPQPKPHKERNL